MESIYLIAILPPEELSQQIDQIRKECSEKFKVYKGLKPPGAHYALPHIYHGQFT